MRGIDADTSHMRKSHLVACASTNYGFRVNDWNRMHFRADRGGDFDINVRNIYNCYMKLLYKYILSRTNIKKV